MKILITLFFATTLHAIDKPVTYWQLEPEDSTPEHWKSYLDLNSINFWKEGDYTPPLPLIWAMKEPTRQNIALYKTYLKKRAGVLETFQQAMKQDRIELIERIVIAFRSDCNACHQLLSELSLHAAIFDRIQLLQIDKGQIQSPWPILRINEQQANRLNVQTVPTVWIKSKGEVPRLLEHPGQLFEEFL
jgi:hypothetical protein